MSSTIPLFSRASAEGDDASEPLFAQTDHNAPRDVTGNGQGEGRQDSSGGPDPPSCPECVMVCATCQWTLQSAVGDKREAFLQYALAAAELKKMANR
ncbi:hypothetical protein MRX96_005128 [Rhipicephalus microplus]